jgi:hypothetical protein
VSDRVVRFSDASWQEIEALPEPLRWTVQRAIFHLLDEPVPTLADPFPKDDPLPGAYELYLPTDHVTIWYTVTPHHGQEVIAIQLVRPDTRAWPSRRLVAARLAAVGGGEARAGLRPAR